MPEYLVPVVLDLVVRADNEIAARHAAQACWAAHRAEGYLKTGSRWAAHCQFAQAQEARELPPAGLREDLPLPKPPPSRQAPQAELY